MAQSSITRGWLIAFNLLSFFGWSMILTTLIKYIAVGPTRLSLPIEYSEKLLASLRAFRTYRFVSYSTLSYIPKPLAIYLDRAASVHGTAGALVAVVQSLAVFEILHAVLGLVKTPVPTTVIQVFSRLWLVWGISERYEQASTSPWYASMVFAWAVTECIRYPFYANALMGSDSGFLQWARYTFFYVLYPLGASSEAILMFRTLPHVAPWTNASAWTLENYFVAVLFVIWWPGLFVMYSHMIRQRRRALGGGKQKQIHAQRKQGAKSVAEASWATGSDNKKSK